MSTNAQTCQVFSCGTISHTDETETNRTCVVFHQTANEAHEVEPCHANYYCPARRWLSPTQGRNSTCHPAVPPVVTNNTRLAGEICMNSTQCFNNENGANCTSMGYCVTPLVEGSACPDIDGIGRGHNYCPVNMFCNSTNQCQRAVGRNGQCDQDTLCLNSLACIATDEEFTNFTCQPFGRIQNGSRFKEFLVNETDEYAGLNSVCEEYNFDETGVEGLRE